MPVTPPSSSGLRPRLSTYSTDTPAAPKLHVKRTMTNHCQWVQPATHKDLLSHTRGQTVLHFIHS